MDKVKYIAMISVTLFVLFTFQEVAADNMPPESSIISYSAGQFKNTDLFKCRKSFYTQLYLLESFIFSNIISK